MLVSAHVRHGIQPNVITEGYCPQGGTTVTPTVRAGDSAANAAWSRFGVWLCVEYTKRYGKVHSPRDS